MKLDPIYDYNNIQQNTTSTSPVDSSCETSALEDGVDYLVIYVNNAGSDSDSNRAHVQLLFGSSVIAQTEGEGKGLDYHWDSVQLQGFARVTGDGSSTLKFQFWIESSGTARVGGQYIIAIPLKYLVEGYDFFYSGTNSDTEEESDVSSSWTTLRSATWNTANTEYIVLMSAECNAGGNSEDSAWKTRYYVGDTELTPTETSVGHLQEWENDNDWDSVVSKSMVTIPEGSNTFKIECASRLNGSSSFRRSRIWAFRKEAFQQIKQTIDTSGDSTTSATYVDFSGLTTSYTPSQLEYVIALSQCVSNNDSDSPTIFRLYQSTDGNQYCVGAGEYLNNSGFNSDSDLVPTLLAATEEISTAKTWKTQYKTAYTPSTSTVGRNRENTAGVQSGLILWGLTTVETIHVSDSISAGLDHLKITNDTISITDSLKTEVETQSNDSVFVTDLLESESIYDKSIDDTISENDDIYTNIVYETSVDDSVNASDLLNNESLFVKQINESISISDQLDKDLIADKNIDDTVDYFDQINSVTNYVRSIEDSENVFDDIISSNQYEKNIEDSIVELDQLLSSLEIGVVDSDSVTIDDEINRNVVYETTINDSLSVSDSSVTGTEYILNIDDANVVSDQLTSSIQKIIEISDTISENDFINAYSELDRSITDSISATDYIEKVALKSVKLNDSIEILDSILSESEYDKTNSDTIIVDDSIQTSFTYISNIDDTVSSTDTFSAESIYLKNIEDSIVVGDFIFAASEAPILIDHSDFISTVDTIETKSDINKIINDNISVNDFAYTELQGVVKEIFDTVSVNEETIVSLEMSASFTDFIESEDLISYIYELGAYASDTINISDTLNINKVSMSPDIITIVDSINVNSVYDLNIIDDINTEDGLYIGDVGLVVFTVEDGIKYGPANIFSVSPTGPVTISGGSEYDPPPTGFVLSKGDYVSYNDSTIINMENEIKLNDFIGIVG